MERHYARWGDLSDYRQSHAGSHDERSSSSDDVADVVYSRRKKLLDDALFEFFSKEAVKSLKRDFSNFCKESHFWKESKKTKHALLDKDCFTVYSFKYFFEVLDRLTDKQKSIILKFGFGCLLALGKTYIPRSFVRWLACCVDSDSSQIIVDDKIVSLSKESFHFVLGLPNCGAEVVENTDSGLDFIMSMFGLSEAPHITFFGDKLKSDEELSDKENFACFMQVAVSCFLCPSATDRLDTK